MDLQRWSLNDAPLVNLTNSNSVAGVALNGVFFFTSANEFKFDPLFPQAYYYYSSGKATAFDTCLGYSGTYNTYRYHTFSPCLYDIPQRIEGQYLCSMNESCALDPRIYALSLIPEELRVFQPIGLARDGRIIYSPFKPDGTGIWQPCEVDVCNGVKFGDYYAYVTTFFFPYVVGCWGPGSLSIDLEASCSTNSRFCAFGQNLFKSNSQILITSLILIYSYY